MYKIIFTLLFASLLSAEVYNGIAIVVKDKAITLLDIKHEMEISKLSATRAADVLIRQKLEEVEIDDRKITVTSSEVYDDIKKLAARNNMSTSDFYDAVRESNGMGSMELKEKTKQKLLSQKLYQSIAYSSVSEPSDLECKEYYEMHKETYKHPASFTVIIYDADDKNELQTKVDNPMFYSPKIRTNEQVLPYSKITPELASLLERTALNSFTNVIPNGKGGFMSFYIKEIESAKAGLVLLEAMALGVPVVSTAVLGTKDVLREGQGALIAPDELIGFSQRVIEILNNDTLAQKISRAGSLYVQEWQAEIKSRKMIEFYNTIINENENDSLSTNNVS